jgi:hypothetical protein
MQQKQLLTVNRQYMKQLFFLAVILLTALTHLQAQNDFTINADSVIITNDGSPAELIIENSTKNIRGLLVNKGNGHTEFRQAQKLNDSMFVFGTDTFTVKGGGKGLQPVTDAGNTTTHYINANGGYYLKNTLLLHATDSILRVGIRAGQSNTSGTGNTAIGYEALQKNVSGVGNVAIGHQALQEDSAYNNVAIGYMALTKNTTGGANVALGASAMYNNTTGSSNVGVGGQRPTGTTTTGSNYVALGQYALTSGNGGVSVGWQAGSGQGNSNTAVGSNAMNGGAMDRNTVMGSSVLYGGAQSDNTVMGAYTLDNNNGYYNLNRTTIVGARSASSYREYTGLTVIGAENGGRGYNNTSVGISSAPDHGLVRNNTSLGSYTGWNMRDVSNNIVLGYRADVPSTEDSFQLSIGNLIYGKGIDGAGNTVSNGKIGVKTKAPAYELDVNGKLGVRSIDNIAAAPNVLFQDPATGEIKKAALATKQTFAQTATATVSGTTAETTLIAAGAGSLTIPAASWFAGKSFRVVVRGVYSSSSSNPGNLVFKIKLGSTVIAQTSEIFIGSGKSNVPFEVRAEIVCRITGASGNVFSRGLVISDDELVVKLDNGSSGTAVDLSADKTLSVTANFNNNAAGNSVSAYILTFEAIN